MKEVYDNILDHLKSVISVCPMNYANGNYVSEASIEIRGYSEYIDKLIDQFEDVTENIQKEQKKRKLKDLEDELDKIIKKCEKDNDFSKKTVSIPDITELNELFRLYNIIGEKMFSFLNKRHENTEDIEKTSSDISDNIEELNRDISFTFSLKVDVSLHFMVKNFYELIEKCKRYFFVSNASKTENYFGFLTDSLKIVKDKEKYISLYFAQNRENLSYTEKEKAKITKETLSAFNSLLPSYNAVSILLFKKCYTMIVSHIDKEN